MWRRGREEDGSFFEGEEGRRAEGERKMMVDGARLKATRSARVLSAARTASSARTASKGRVRGSARSRVISKSANEEVVLEAKLSSVKDKVVVIDNYDSFTFNLCQYLGNLDCQYVVFKNDEVTVDQIESAKPKGILVSPGPGTPEESGISLETVEKLGPKFPLFGVCLGHQCIGQVFGGKWHKGTPLKGTLSSLCSFPLCANLFLFSLPKNQEI